MAKAKITTRGKSRTVTGRTAPTAPSIIQMLDKANDIGRGITALENAADGAFLDKDATDAIGWMLDHLDREHRELVAMLTSANAANGGANV